VKPTRTKFSIEMSPWTLPTTADEYLKLIRAVDRRAFGVHLDICNIVNSPYKMYGNAEVIRETYTKLGPWILSCHVKDLKWNIGMAVCFEETIPGKGQMDFAAWVRAHAALPGDVPFMMEHMKAPESYVEGRKYILSVAQAQNIRVL
jgi:sugar phosphate isomerase/epimerase